MKTIDDKDCQIMFGAYIKAARERKGMSQCQVAEALGVTQVYLSYLESGKRNIDLILALRVCEILGVDMRDFINRCL